MAATGNSRNVGIRNGQDYLFLITKKNNESKKTRRAIISNVAHIITRLIVALLIVICGIACFGFGVYLIHKTWNNPHVFGLGEESAKLIGSIMIAGSPVIFIVAFAVFPFPTDPPKKNARGIEN